MCGDSVKEANEACDDGNTASGDGCSSTCRTESAVPRLDLVLDKTAMNAELKTTQMLTVTLAGSGGFNEAVSLTGSAVDASGAAIPGWTVTFDNATVNVSDGGTADVVATLTIPSENRGLSGMVKINADSSLGSKSVTSAVSVTNQVTVQMTLDSNGQCVYPPAGTLRVTTGSKIRFLNKATDNITIHMQDEGAPGTNLRHQSDPGSVANAAYEQTLTSTAGGRTRWYCHAPGPTVNGLIIEAVAP